MALAPVAHPPKEHAKVRFRAACLQDYPQIAALESKFGLDTKSYEDWSHLWTDNPVYRELRSDWAIGWVLEDADKQIVGSIGNIPLLYEFEGKRVLAASGRGWVAQPEYRSLSLGLLDSVVNQSGVDLYVNNTVSLASLASVLAFQCLRAPTGVWDQSAFWITNYIGFTRSFLSGKCTVKRLKPLSGPLSVSLRLKDLLRQRNLRQGQTEVRECSHFDSRFHDFWEQLKRKHPHMLLAVRTPEMMQWHFQPAIAKSQLWIATVPDGARLAAYAIYDRRDNPASGLRRARLVDFQSLDGGTDLLSPLLSWALNKCRAEGIHVLENTGRWLEPGGFMDTFAPHRRTLPIWTYFYRANHPGLGKKLCSPDAWAPSSFDGDASL